MVQELIEAITVLLKLAARRKFGAAMRGGVRVLVSRKSSYVGGGGGDSFFSLPVIA